MDTEKGVGSVDDLTKELDLLSKVDNHKIYFLEKTDRRNYLVLIKLQVSTVKYVVISKEK